MFGIMTKKTNTANRICYKECSVVMQGKVNNQIKKENKKFTTFAYVCMFNFR